MSSNAIDIEVDATDALRKLADLANRIENAEPIVENLSNEMADNIVNIAKGTVAHRTYALMDSVHYEGAYPTFIFTADAVDKYGVEYGVFVEYGTSMQEPQPFLEPAVNEGVRDARIIIKQEIMRFLREG